MTVLSWSLKQEAVALDRRPFLSERSSGAQGLYLPLHFLLWPDPHLRPGALTSAQFKVLSHFPFGFFFDPRVFLKYVILFPNT